VLLREDHGVELMNEVFVAMVAAYLTSAAVVTGAVIAAGKRNDEYEDVPYWFIAVCVFLWPLCLFGALGYRWYNWVKDREQKAEK
jgi:4-hydroxybenzoate polyprenyltransferase